MKPLFRIYLVFLVLLTVASLSVLAYCVYPDAIGCIYTGGACSSNLDCISKKCVDSVCVPNHSSTLNIEKVIGGDFYVTQVYLTSKSEPKFVFFYNETVSGELWQRVSILKKSDGSWQNNIRYSQEDSESIIFGDVSGYFDNGSEVYFNVARLISCGSTCRMNYEVFGGENDSNQVFQIVSQPVGSQKTYIEDFLTPRFRINQVQSSINLACVKESDKYHSELLYGNPLSYFTPTLVYRFTTADYTVGSSCVSGQMFFDKQNNKTVITTSNDPLSELNNSCKYLYCEGQDMFPYSCSCLNDSNFYHTPLIAIDSLNRSVLFSFFGNKLSECTQTITGLDCKNYTLQGMNFSPPFFNSTWDREIDVEIVNNIPYIAAVIDSSKILLCDKSNFVDYTCRVIVDVNYLLDSSDSQPDSGSNLVSDIELSSIQNKLLISYVVRSANNNFHENGLYITDLNVPTPCSSSGDNCSKDADCCNNDCLRGICSICGMLDGVCIDECDFSRDADCLCGNGVIDEGENCGTCALDVHCGDGNYCNEAKTCVPRIFIDSNCGNRIIDSGETCSNCPADVKCLFNQTCANGACQNVNSISEFSLLIDNNKLYGKIKCLSNTTANFDVFVDSTKIGSLSYPCNETQTTLLLGDADKKGVTYSSSVKISPFCEVCSKDAFIRVDAMQVSAVFDYSFMSIIFVLLCIVFIFKRKN